jgi:hypothetical protein
MGYLYGLVLLSFIAADLGRQHQLHTSRLARALAPALCTGVVLLVILASRFGLCTVFRSLLPSAGYRGYGELGFGVKSLFGLFYFRGVKPGYYVGTPVLFWALATIYLFASAALASMRCLRIRNAEIVISCAVMHFGFITFFFGAPSSWTYYAYIPIISAVETANWGSKARKMLWTLCIFAALANISGVKAAIQAWHSTRDADTAWLFATPTERAEWNQITLMAQHTYADVFTWDGGAEMLFPWLCKPVGAFIVPGVVTKSELSRKLRRLQSVQLVIVPTFNGDQFEKWPDKEFATALNDMSIAFAGTYFKVYRRESFPPGTTGSCGE